MIREAQTDECEAMAQIHAASFEYNWSASEIGTMLAEKNVIALIDVHGDEVRGFIMLRYAADECEILTIAVAKDWQRNGIGKALLLEAHRHALQRHATRIFLEVAEDNFNAIALYTALAYQENGRRKGYYRRWHGRRIDALTFALTLTK
ncbi:MAG: ribosomal protein S18-alanine N-acetyltransferase [Alphaproteobacteria bacterium]|nr:ribosomal protein S18-alanine N-acetyltransferase [Alphaproteobacteria bacterium]